MNNGHIVAVNCSYRHFLVPAVPSESALERISSGIPLHRRKDDQMYYDIDGLCPRTDLDLGKHGFCIKLYPEWRGLVVNRGLTQENVETAMETMGRAWLDACGYSGIFDPENCGCDKDPSKPPGRDARPMYKPNQDLRVSWGEWGPEHITVPGNACGLDLDRGISAPPNGRILLPHNIDNRSQKLLLLVVFTWFANDLAANRLLSADVLTPAEGQGGPMRV